MTEKRGRQEIIYAFLKTINDTPQKLTHILNKINCNYATYKIIKIKMLDKKLINIINSTENDNRTRQLIQITEDGKAYLKLLSQVA